ncbi:unnamed protein product [Effrenium voratum]|nr:unnamed protein product [Effrenium voratum]
MPHLGCASSSGLNPRGAVLCDFCAPQSCACADSNTLAGGERSLATPLAISLGMGGAAAYLLYLEHLDQSKVMGPEVSLEQASSPDNPRVWLDITVGEGRGRVTCELFPKVCPKTAENFRCLCTGEKGIDSFGRPLHYKGSPFHRIMPGLLCQGGDFVNGNGMGGESIYGPTFPDEFEHGVVKHSEGMLLSMANAGPDTNASQFFITTARMHHLDGKHVVFGRVLDGQEVVRVVEKCGSPSGKPIALCVITNCGQCP